VVAVTTSEPILRVRDLALRFGGVTALDGVSFDVAPGGLTAIIGPNGAGKTSLFNCISGFYPPTAGTIEFAGRDITRLTGHRIPRLGIGRTFQSPGVFDGATVLENLLVGRHLHSRASLTSGALMAPWARRDERRQRERAEQMLSLLGLSAHGDALAKDLAYGLRKRLDFGRALIAEPRLLLLDEPMAGMSSDEKAEMSQLMRYARETVGATLVLVEHDMSVVMAAATHVVVLDFGRKIADGTVTEVQASPEVIAAYLGAELAEDTGGHEPAGSHA
jgi:branched-chain amino acid transport system ATP-binding protein